MKLHGKGGQRNTFKADPPMRRVIMTKQFYPPRDRVADNFALTHARMSPKPCSKDSKHLNF